jgi:chemotaxis response regulator CheB
MKVTKLIREHIEEQINTLYAPAIDSVNNELSGLKKQADTAQENIKEKVRKLAFDFLKENGFINKDKSNNAKDALSLYVYAEPKEIVEAKLKLEKKKQEIKAKRDKTIMDILLELELGGNKETLDSLLEKANKDFSKIKY